MKQRNNYIDIMKLIFAVMVVMFHYGGDLLPGGRLAVEGFFMISGYFMMKSIERDRHADDQLGLSTVHFIGHKLASLFPILLASIIVNFILAAVKNSWTLNDIWRRIQLTPPAVLTLYSAGYSGNWLLGIDWYLSSMMLTLLLLYPFCRRFKTNFVLTVCVPLCIFCYGFIDHAYGNLAVNAEWLENPVIQTSMLRSFGGITAGCILYECTRVLEMKDYKKPARILLGILEVVLFAYFIYECKYEPKTKFDFVAVMALFGSLLISISGIGLWGFVFKGRNIRWTKLFTTMSTVIVMNNITLSSCYQTWRGQKYAYTLKGEAEYVGWLVVACLIAWLLSKLIEFLISKLSDLFKTT